MSLHERIRQIAMRDGGSCFSRDRQIVPKLHFSHHNWVGRGINLRRPGFLKVGECAPEFHGLTMTLKVGSWISSTLTTMN